MQPRPGHGGGETRQIQHRGVAGTREEMLESQVGGRRNAVRVETTAPEARNTEAHANGEVKGREITTTSAAHVGGRILLLARDRRVEMAVQGIWGGERDAGQENQLSRTIEKSGDGSIEYAFLSTVFGTQVSNQTFRWLRAASPLHSRI